MAKISTAKRGPVRASAALAALALTTLHPAAPAAAQQGGGHPDMQTVVLLSLVAKRGPECGTVAPWEALMLQTEARRLFEHFEPEERRTFRLEAIERAAAMACDDVVIVNYPKANREIWETQELPKRLAAYRAFAVMDEPPEIFRITAPRLDYGTAVRAVDARFGALEVAGVAAPGRGSWADYLDRVDAAVAERAATLRGEEGERLRVTPDEAAAYVVEAALVGEAWLAEALGEE
jgi:hypothetical protein